jgi:hypothetical protein
LRSPNYIKGAKMRKRRVTVDLRLRGTKANYRYFNTKKFRYHVTGIELRDDTEMLKKLILSIQRGRMPVPQNILDRAENPKYFLVYTKVHGPKGRGFVKPVMVPFDLAKDELGAYTEVQKLVGGFAVMIKPKGVKFG